MTTAEILNAAADLIEPEGRWTQKVIARDSSGRKVNANDPAACQWCAMGALCHVFGVPVASEQHGTILEDAQSALERVIPTWLATHWNDASGRTQAEVVAALREAAKLAEATQ